MLKLCARTIQIFWSFWILLKHQNQRCLSDEIFWYPELFRIRGTSRDRISHEKATSDPDLDIYVFCLTFSIEFRLRRNSFKLRYGYDITDFAERVKNFITELLLPNLVCMLQQNGLFKKAGRVWIMILSDVVFDFIVLNHYSGRMLKIF